MLQCFIYQISLKQVSSGHFKVIFLVFFNNFMLLKVSLKQEKKSYGNNNWWELIDLYFTLFLAEERKLTNQLDTLSNYLVISKLCDDSQRAAL